MENIVESKEIEYLKFLALLREGYSAPNPLTGVTTRMGREDCMTAGHRVVTSLRRMVAEVAQSGFGGKVLPFLSLIESEEELGRMVEVIGHYAEVAPVVVEGAGKNIPADGVHRARAYAKLAEELGSGSFIVVTRGRFSRVGLVGIPWQGSLARMAPPTKFAMPIIGVDMPWPKVEYIGDLRQINPRQPMPPEGLEGLELALDGRIAPKADKAKARKGLDFLGGLGYRKGCKNGRM